MQWQFDDERPIYSQLVEQIERAIAAGEIPPGERLPGVRELAAEAGVNPNTMQRALAGLESTGLVYAQRTSGRFVTSDEARIAALRSRLAAQLAQSFVQGLRALGCGEDEIDALVREARAQTGRAQASPAAKAQPTPTAKEESNHD